MIKQCKNNSNKTCSCQSFGRKASAKLWRQSFEHPPSRTNGCPAASTADRSFHLSRPQFWQPPAFCTIINNIITIKVILALNLLPLLAPHLRWVAQALTSIHVYYYISTFVLPCQYCSILPVLPFCMLQVLNPNRIQKTRHCRKTLWKPHNNIMRRR